MKYPLTEDRGSTLLLALLCMAAAGSGNAATISLDGAGVPSGVTLSSTLAHTPGTGVVVDSSTTTNLPDSADEGYAEVFFAHADLSNISGLPVAVRADRLNAIADGNFESGTFCTSSADWYTCSGASLVTSGFGTGDAAELRVAASSSTHAYIDQEFLIDPGELYRIRYRVNASGMLPAYDGGYDDGFLHVRIKYLDSSGSLVEPRLPDTGITAVGSNWEVPAVASVSPAKYYEVVALHRSTTPVGMERHRVAMLDCEEHPLYDSGSSEATFTRYVPSTTCEDDVYYAQLTFLLDVTGSVTASSDSVIQIDDVFVDWDRQVEIRIYDAGSDTLLQSSTVDQGFMVEDIASDPDYTDAGVYLRVYLRTQSSSDSPVLKKILINENANLAVSVGSQITSFAAPRLGADMHIPPRAIFDDASGYPSLDTECEDPFSSGTWLDCWDLFADYGVINQRMFLNPSALEWSGTDWTGSLTSEGEDFFTRIGQAVSAGLDVLMLYPVHGAPYLTSSGDGDMTMWEGVTDSDGDNSYEDCDLRYDDGGSGSDQEQSEDRIIEAAAILTDLLDVSNNSFGADVDDFEVFNEPNLDTFDPKCEDMLTSGDVPALMELVADEMLLTRPGVNVSFSGLESGDGPVFDVGYLSDDLLPALSGSNFTHTNFHPYTKNNRPERTLLGWQKVEAELALEGWVTQSHWLTEFAYSRAEFEPSCIGVDNAIGGWESRGYGEEEQAKLTARATLTQLALPVEKVLIWGQMSNEAPTGAGLSGTCWESMPSQNKVIFERVAGTGPLSGATTTTQYQANAAGAAFLSIGSHLSTSSPHNVTSVVPTTAMGAPMPASERYYATAYEGGADFWLGLWFFREYEFGLVRADLGETSEVDYQGLLYGAQGCASTDVVCSVKDNGFEETRRHEVSVTGVPSFGSVSTVYQVDLATNEETELDFTTLSAYLIVHDVVLGEMPTLLRFVY